jgi:GNAT superfamily N-acetyltransferase
MSRPPLNIRQAARDDVPEIVRIFASDDMFGQEREIYRLPLPQFYYDAFVNITQHGNNLLMVAELEHVIVGTLQLSFTYNMSYQGAKRATIEGVHVDSAYRNQKIGGELIEWAIAEAKRQGARLVQVTSNKKRVDAHRFYQRLGFTLSHEGFKMEIR